MSQNESVSKKQVKKHRKTKQQEPKFNLEPSGLDDSHQDPELTSILSFSDDDSMEVRISSWLEKKGVYRSYPNQKEESFFAEKKNSARRKWSLMMNMNSMSPKNPSSEISSLDSNKTLKLSVGGSSLLKRRLARLAEKKGKGVGLTQSGKRSLKATKAKMGASPARKSGEGGLGLNFGRLASLRLGCKN